ncbi:eugenol synthase 1-like [Olea europaea subsp. europaea]|uniref:Eugenol synthase 1-like n=1 Tax=Olea europaea subsp. europaea TaxID=158383 RepID=A0A8S0PKC8_OLEEU|nr:eugenol synthase 1-like [Olea europaea subsp. europaea]
MARNESKILIIGGTGYIGSYMVKASIKLGHPTYVYSRPNSSKKESLNEFESMGALIVKGELQDHEKLVSVIREVDVVISAVAYPQVLDQLNIIEAIKVAGGIKRFLPSDFGCEEDRISVLPPFQAFLDKKKKIRRAIEQANIPYTFVSANCFGAYFINYLLHPHELKEEITVYGSGQAKGPNKCIQYTYQLILLSLLFHSIQSISTFVHQKNSFFPHVLYVQAVLNFEEDIGIYTIKVATDPRACNRVVLYRPPTNIISQLELISLWEKKTGRTFKKIHVPEEKIVTLSKTLPDPNNIPVSILHSVFIKGVTMNFDLGENDIEASLLYPDIKFTTVDDLLDVFLRNPPKPASAAFE